MQMGRAVLLHHETQTLARARLYRTGGLARLFEIALALVLSQRTLHRSTGLSWTTSFGSLSVRKPRKTGWRNSPSSVHSPNFTSATSFGRTQWLVFGSGGGGGGSNGQRAVASGLSLAMTALSDAPSKPVPTAPQKTSAPFWYTPSSNAPNSARAPCGSVQPPMTNSCSRCVLILSQSRDRRS